VARPCKDCRVFKVRPFEHRFRSISFVHHNSTGAVDPPQSHCVVNFSSNFNQRWVADMGLPGPDGPKGKFLLLSPDYKGEVPSGYHVATSKKTRSSAAARCGSNPSPIADPIARTYSIIPICIVLSPAAVGTGALGLDNPRKSKRGASTRAANRSARGGGRSLLRQAFGCA
jgi:hypothetical protein